VLEVGNNQDKGEKEEGLPVFGGGQIETSNDLTDNKVNRPLRPIRHAASFQTQTGDVRDYDDEELDEDCDLVSREAMKRAKSFQTLIKDFNYASLPNVDLGG
jgi:hypothetical protein